MDFGEVDGELGTNDGIYVVNRPGEVVAGVNNIVGQRALVSHALGAAWIQHLNLCDDISPRVHNKNISVCQDF